MLRELVTCNAPRADAWAFGSRVSGGAHEGSDLDLVLRNVDDPALAVGGVAALREALQQSLLPSWWTCMTGPHCHTGLVAASLRVVLNAGIQVEWGQACSVGSGMCHPNAVEIGPFQAV